MDLGSRNGSNEYGVAIGNEATFTKEKYQKEGGLLGMNLLRLTIERAKSAKEAMEVIVDLLELYDQGGNHGYRKKELYHLSYIIADKKEAWVLETSGKYWVAEKVKDIKLISNTITIRGKGDIRHPELTENALNKGWCKNPEKFDFYNDYRDKFKLEQIFALGMNRCMRSYELLNCDMGNIDETTMMNIFRDHVPIKKDWNPAKDATYRSLCVHQKGIFTITQSTITMVSVLDDKIQTHWITGTATPCTAIFKPIFIPGGMPEIGTKTTAYYDSKNI